MNTWIDIKGYEGLYQINQFGNVKSLSYNNTNKEKLLIPKANHRGYLQVWLSKNNKVNVYSVHRLVAENFIGSSDKEVNHKDGNKLNNHVNNLEWVTKSENISHAYKNGLMDNVKNSIIEANSRILIDSQTGIFYNSIKEACLVFNLKHPTLMNMLKGRCKNRTNLIYA